MKTYFFIPLIGLGFYKRFAQTAALVALCGGLQSCAWFQDPPPPDVPARLPEKPVPAAVPTPADTNPHAITGAVPVP